MAFGDQHDVRVANALLLAVRELSNVGRVSGIPQYSQDRSGRSNADGDDAEVTILGAVKAALNRALTRVVDGNADHAAELRDYLTSNPESTVEVPLWTLVQAWFPLECWNAFCVNSYCPGIQHVDNTGHSWKQRVGFVYNTATHKYDLPEADHVGVVMTVYRRDAVVREALSE